MTNAEIARKQFDLDLDLNYNFEIFNLVLKVCDKHRNSSDLTSDFLKIYFVFVS